MNYWVIFLPFWIAFFGFEQSTDLDVIQILALMAALLVIPPIIVTRMMSATARAYCETNDKWVPYFLGGITVLTVFLYEFGDTQIHRYASNEFTRFGALWWCCWPYGCLGLLMADRVFDAFDKLTPPSSPEPRLLLDNADTGVGEDDQEEEEAGFVFDANRFKKDRLH